MNEKAGVKDDVLDGCRFTEPELTTERGVEMWEMDFDEHGSNE
jgi:hypothetical protein